MNRKLLTSRLSDGPTMSRRQVTKFLVLMSASALTSCLANSEQSAATGDQPLGGPPGNGSGGPPPGGGPGRPGGSQTITDEFLGVTTDGNVIDGLFPIKATGVSTEPIRTAAETFLASLTDDQRSAIQFPLDDDEWRMWNNVDNYSRQGVSLQEMTQAQRVAAFDLLAAALSAKGFDYAQDIMKLNTVQGELLDSTDRFNELLYWFTMMGNPSATDPWGFQIDGHHLSVNYLILGDQVVMAPVFLGAEPPVAPTSTTYAGTAVLQIEQDRGLSFVQSLSAEQQAIAILSSDKTTDDLQAGAFSDNAVIPYAGIVGTDLTDEQRSQLLALIGEWIGVMREGHAEIKMSEVENALDETYFSWIGSTGDDAVFYYRIQSPVVLIEFDHQRPGPLGQNPEYAGDLPTRQHIHSMIRTPNGNDYGKSLIALHLQAYAHVQTSAGVVHVPRLSNRR